MKKQIFLPVFLFALFIFNGCENDNNKTVVGTGDIVSMDVEVPEFSGVSVIGQCNVDIQIGHPKSVKLSAQQEILNVMTYKVIGGILQISFDPDVTVKTDKEISADIVIPAVSSVAVTGAGNFVLSGAQQSSLDIFITGAGDVRAYNMKVEDCDINISGVGNCWVWVNNTLDVNISGVGNVYYRGDPDVSSSISGVGIVEDDNN